MDWNRVEGNWKQIKGKVREKWAELTDDDLARMDGKREQFEGVLQERYGEGRDRIREEVDTWLKTLKS
ncbi:MAG: CsbD family protein [Methylocystis sp.]|nr:CsbD family protein [Methylocystis sp.]MBI5313499.1 CsbD family protein [Methylocystis sp.]